MRISPPRAVLIFLLFTLPTLAQSGAVIPQGGAGHAQSASCVILKRMGPADQVTSHLYSFGIRGKQFQYVEGKLPDGFPFHGRLTDHDVRNMQGRGAEVIVLNQDFTAEDLKQARADCREETGKTPNQANAKSPELQPQNAANLSATNVNATAIAQLDMTSNPSGAEIELDGNFAGNTPSTVGVAAGDHTLKITKNGFKTWEKKIRSSSGTGRVVAELEPNPVAPVAAPAALPPAANALVSEAPHPVVVPSPVRPESEPVIASTPTSSSAPQLRPAVLSSASVVPSATSASSNHADASGSQSSEDGTVSVTSTPDGADIFVDSVGKGHAPSLLKLKPGKHRIQLVATGYKDWIGEIEVKANSIVNVTGKLEQ